jgi:phospholipase C
MAGVRGFSDPNVHKNNGMPVWQQPVNATAYLNPFYLNYLGGDWLNATQCMVAGSNGWAANQLAYDHGLNDHWAVNNTPWSWGHFKRDDIPVQFAIADSYTVADMYQQSVISSTNPNRVTWMSGSINVPGSPQTKDQGGYPYIDNNETPGCDANGINCYPLSWKTAAEFYEDAGVSWMTYQDADNFDDNALAWFRQFQNAPTSSNLYKRGFQGLSLDTFVAQAANGTLPEISYIVGPTELSEHPPYSPRDGAWLQKRIVDAVTSSPKYSKTVLMISWDETGGFGDQYVRALSFLFASSFTG